VGDKERATSLTNVQAQHTSIPDKRHYKRRLGSDSRKPPQHEFDNILRCVHLCARRLDTSSSHRHSTTWTIGDLSGGFMPGGSHHFDIQSGMASPSRLARELSYLCCRLRHETEEHDHMTRR